jgi:hypothetical protein
MNPESPNKALWGVETELWWCYSFRLQFCYNSLQDGAGSWVAEMGSSKPVTHPTHFSLNNQSSPRQPFSIIELPSSNEANNLFRHV